MKMIRHCFAAPAVFGLALTVLLAFGCTPKGEEAPAEEPIQEQQIQNGDSADALGDAIPYPLDYCLVTNEKLGSMGDPLSKVFEGQEFKVCCAGCLDSIAKDVPGYLAKLEAANKTTE